jgi:hypothetical protein
LLHGHRPVFPLAFGGPDHPDDWSVCDWCDQCHRKGGLVTWVEPFAPGGEALAALLLGKIDAIEADDRPRRVPLLVWYYRLLNLGVRVPLVGASGKESNSTPLGRVRTYARLPVGEPVTLSGWAAAVRAGRCFATAGPLLAFTVNGRDPGEAVEVPGPGERLSVVATARSRTPFDRLEVVADGDVIATAAPADGTATVEVAVERSHAGWLAARTVGAGGGFAHTGPISVTVPGQPFPHRRMFAPLVRQSLDHTRDWVETVGRFADPRSRDRLLTRLDEAAAIL